MEINSNKKYNEQRCGKIFGAETQKVTAIDYFGKKLTEDGKIGTNNLNRTKKDTQIYYR